MGSDELVSVEFNTHGGTLVGGARIKFSSPPRYNILKCSANGNNYEIPGSSKIPKDGNMIWKITLSVTDEGARILLHCNDVEVLNILTSDSECQDSNWKNFWTSSMNVVMLVFETDDTASDFYSLQQMFPPGNISF